MVLDITTKTYAEMQLVLSVADALGATKVGQIDFAATHDGWATQVDVRPDLVADAVTVFVDLGATIEAIL